MSIDAPDANAAEQGNDEVQGHGMILGSIELVPAPMSTSTVSKDKEKVYIPAARVPKFSAGSALKSEVKG